ncbi:MAG: hypothetical protein MUO72_09500 [Bacteroidales bacterium]|nr:hypothetical protein [Bacteroidales bacterium]
MITLVSTPAYVDPADPSVICRWLATESPNNFRLQRRDYIILNSGPNAGYMSFQPDHTFTGVTGASITVVDSAGNSYTGTISSITDPDLQVDTSLLWSSFIAPPSYVNDNTQFKNYYFEGQLTINGILYPLTIIASPDSKGYADLDVSGILRIVTSLGKVGNYTSRIMKETTKSGKFEFEYRGCWIGSTESWQGDIVTSPIASPPICNTWYYGESVRSEEQGSNLHDFVADALNDAPFLNQFEQPVYYLGLPFDLSFILPEIAIVSPMSDIKVEINIYDANNLPLSNIVENIPADQLEGYICSLNIDQASIPAGAAFMTVEITV